ncbi:MAG: hypothetical protein ACE5JL_07380 [Dehalococcoidia bacterium]
MKKNQYLAVVITFGMIAVVATSFMASTKAQAIPVFARKYRTACTTCHIGFPKLTPFGEAFRRNGYQVPAVDEAFVKEEPVALGADAWKEVWPRGVWPGAIPGLPPMSLRVENALSIVREVEHQEENVRADFVFPEELALLTGGTLGEDISFYGDIDLFDENEPGHIGRLFIQFDNLLDNWFPEYLFNLRVGQFEPGVLAFSNHRRLTLTPYLFNMFTIADNNFRFEPAQQGFELNGTLWGRLGYAAGVVNGTGIGEGEFFDDNSEKDGYGRIELKLFGTRLDGEQDEGPEVLAQAENWRDDSIRIGAFIYAGESNITPHVEVEDHHEEEEEAEAIEPEPFTDQFERVGGDVRLQVWNLDLFGAVLYGNNDDPDAERRRDRVNYVSWFGEVDWVVFPWMVAAFRWEEVDPDSGLADTKRAVGSLITYPRANIRMVFEGRFGVHSDNADKYIAALDYVF